MITTEFDERQRLGRIILRPNQSWTWRANTMLVGSLLVVSLFIGFAFTAQGFWMILPFTVLELSILGASLYYCVRRTHRQEVLIFSPEALVLERGVRRPEQRIEFQRFFTRFFVKGPRHPWYRKRVAVRCRNQEVEIGSFFGVEELDDLIGQLQTMIRRMDQLPTADATGVRQ